MRNTTNAPLRAIPHFIRRAAAFATLSLVGVVGAQAADTSPVSLSEDVCFSCAYADGLAPQASAPAEIGLAFEAVETTQTEAAAVDEAPAANGGFATTSDDNARLILPSRTGNRAERLPWSRSEKVLLWSFASFSAMDAYQTMNAPAGVVEANPLLSSWAGEHPSALETVAFKTATAYGMYYVAGKIKKRSTRRVALALMNIIQVSVVAHNESVTGGSY